MRKPQTKVAKAKAKADETMQQAILSSLQKEARQTVTWSIPTPQEVGSASDLLSQASFIVSGSRQQTHGQKERSFHAIAAMWNTYLESRALSGTAPFDITAVDVANMMTLLKITRSIQGTPIREFYVDAAAYSGIAGEIALAGK